MPCESSNTYALYERGWCGIVIDPLIGISGRFAELWQQLRPRDHAVAMAVGAEIGMLDLYVCAHMQMSTGCREISDNLDMQKVIKKVPVTTLNCLLEQHHQDIHLMSLDVEGMEDQALAGLDLSCHRPWLIVVEHTNGDAWEPRLLNHEYDRVFDDGSDRFYLAREHDDLKQWFRFPPHTLEYVSWRELCLEQRIKQLEDEIAASAVKRATSSLTWTAQMRSSSAGEMNGYAHPPDAESSAHRR